MLDDLPPAILGELPKQRFRNVTYEPGRICSRCPTILSRYNPGTECSVHGSVVLVRLGARR